jgi:hypothetical protein
MLPAGDSGRIHPAEQRALSMRSVLRCGNADPRMSAMLNRRPMRARRNLRPASTNLIVANESEVPALCVRDQEVAEYLYAGD